ncbi:MAG: helix-turn-helix domain-containing protein, partial [Candidatus Helarchaeota archaeon]
METSQNMKKIIMDGLELSEPEANAFVALYAKGYVTSSSIATYAEVDMETAKGILQKFVEKGLAIQISAPMENVYRYMPTVPWGAFTSYLDNFKDTVANHRLDLDKHVKEHIDTLKKEVQILKDSVSNAVNNQIEKFNEETLKSKEKTSQTIAKHITDLNDNVEKRKQDTSAAYSEKIDKHKKLIKEDFETETSNALDVKFDVITEGCKAIEDETSSGHEKDIKVLQDNVNKTFDDYKSKTQDILNDYQKNTFSDYDQFITDLDQHQNETFSQYDSWYEDLSKKLLDQINLEVKGVYEKNETLKNYTKESQEKDYDWFKDRAALMRERAAKTFNDEIENQENTFSQFKDSI